MPEFEKVPKKRALMLLHPGFEEIEAVTPADLLRRAGVEVVLASLEEDPLVEGGRGLVVRADVALAELRDPARDFDMLVLPGGPGVAALRADPARREAVTGLLRRFHAEGKWIAAICAAPLLLLDAGLADGLRLTSFPGEAETLRAGAGRYVEDRVALDGRIVTSRGAGTSEEFSLALIALLAGASAAEEIRRRIVARV
jgi:4-methyl-5(b-hydroxyethyl)-thiazole monophosphate biosynthesis